MTKIPTERGMMYWNAASCGPWAHSLLFSHDFSHDFKLILLEREISSPASRPKWNAFVWPSFKKAFTCIPGWYQVSKWRLFCYLTTEYLPKKLFVSEPCVVWWLRITATVFIDCCTRWGSNPVRSEYWLGDLNTGNVWVVWR